MQGNTTFQQINYWHMHVLRIGNLFVIQYQYEI